MHPEGSILVGRRAGARGGMPQVLRVIVMLLVTPVIARLAERPDG